MDFTREQISLRGIKTNYLASKLQFPQKPILVFIHVFPDNAYVWQYQWEELGKSYDWLAPFLPGTCESDKSIKKRFNVESLILDYLQILTQEKYNNRKIILIGHDLGGPIIDLLNESLGKRSLGVVYLNTFSLGHFKQRVLDPKQMRKSYYMLLFQVPKVPEFLMNKLTQKTLGRIYDLGGVNKDDELRHSIANVFRPIKLYRQYLRRILLNKQSKQENKNKKLLILGTKDPFITIPTLDAVSYTHLTLPTKA